MLKSCFLLLLRQEQFYQLWERAPDSAAYNSGFTSYLRGPVNMPALQAAARMMFKRQQVGNGRRPHFGLLIQITVIAVLYMHNIAQ